jgi:hypothetical protein
MTSFSTIPPTLCATSQAITRIYREDRPELERIISPIVLNPHRRRTRPFFLSSCLSPNSPHTALVPLTTLSHT